MGFTMTNKVDVLIPARKGSVGLPGKNTRTLIDRPLIRHSVACAQRLNDINRIFVSTDDPGLASDALEWGAYVPELRPESLASGRTPMSDVIRYAVSILEESGDSNAEFLLLLDPTSPLRDSSAIDLAVEALSGLTELDGVVSVSIPTFNPLWVGVERNAEGLIRRHPITPKVYTRRQDVPVFWRINGGFYLWRMSFARGIEADWLDRGKFLGWETPEILSHSIDTIEDLQVVEALILAGVVSLPWMSDSVE